HLVGTRTVTKMDKALKNTPTPLSLMKVTARTTPSRRGWQKGLREAFTPEEAGKPSKAQAKSKRTQL
ncbi:hypothetical protein, partial [Streptomyces sp. NPDC055085]